MNKTQNKKMSVEGTDHKQNSSNQLNSLSSKLMTSQERDSTYTSEKPNVLKNKCISMGYKWHEEQRLPYDNAYEPLGVISTEIKPSENTLLKLSKAKEDRNYQNQSSLETALQELLEKDRAKNLIMLLSPPGRFQGESQTSILETSWASFVKKIKLAINQAISKDEAILLAASDAGQVSFPHNILDDSIIVARDQGNIENLIKSYRTKVSEGGLSRQSILRTLGEDHPQVPLLLDMIENGARLIPSTDFKPIIYPFPARILEIKLGHAVLKAYLDLHSEHKGIIIDPRVLDPSIFAQKSYVDNHWTTKVEKGKIVPTGRITIDPSNPPPGVEPLNGEILKSNATELYGQPKTPLFSEMIKELLSLCDEHKIKTSEIRIAKGDVPGAYTKFPWDINSCLLMCNRISRDFIYIPTNGNFGTSSAPAIFDCIMRPIDELISKTLTLEKETIILRDTSISPQVLFPKVFGHKDTINQEILNTRPPNTQDNTRILPQGTQVAKVFRIVDDYIEFAPKYYAEASHELVKHFLESYFGPGKGWKRSKDLPPNTIQIVSGLGLDLSGEIGIVFLPDNHYDKLLRSLFLFSLNRAHSLKEYQAIGSLLERAALMIQGLSSYLTGIYRMLTKFDGATMSTHVSIHKNTSYRHPDSLCKMCIQMARVICFWMFIDPAIAAVPIQTVLSKSEIPLSYKGWSDAGTNCPIHQDKLMNCECHERENRIGVLIQSPTGRDLAYASLMLGSPNDYPEVFQVHREFLGKLVILITLSKLEICSRGIVLTIIGDNTAALAWAEKNKVKSRVCVNMNAAANFFLLHTGVIEAKPIQVRSEEMGLVDVLSRGNPLIMSDTSLPPLTSDMRGRLNQMQYGYIDLNSDIVMQSLLPLILPPKLSDKNAKNNDSTLLHSLDAIIQILQIIRQIPRRGDWSNNIPLYSYPE